MFELQPESFKLCMLGKKLIKLGGFDFRGYVVSMMVMFYLQNQRILPSVRSVQSGLAKKEIDGQLKAKNISFLLIIILLHF